MAPKLPNKAVRSQSTALAAVRGLNASEQDPLAWLIWMPSDCTPRPPQILPASDVREHVLETYSRSKRCWCEPLYTDEGILVHNSADGRECYAGDVGFVQLRKH